MRQWRRVLRKHTRRPLQANLRLLPRHGMLWCNGGLFRNLFGNARRRLFGNMADCLREWLRVSLGEMLRHHRHILCRFLRLLQRHLQRRILRVRAHQQYLRQLPGCRMLRRHPGHVQRWHVLLRHHGLVHIGGPMLQRKVQKSWQQRSLLSPSGAIVRLYPSRLQRHGCLALLQQQLSDRDLHLSETAEPAEITVSGSRPVPPRPSSPPAPFGARRGGRAKGK